MAIYFNPPEGVARGGRFLRLAGDFAELKKALHFGEALFGLYDRGFCKNAVFLKNEKEFLVFEEQARAGVIRRIGFYAVSRERAEAVCGRLPVP